jgi:hypothetical protein
MEKSLLACAVWMSLLPSFSWSLQRKLQCSKSARRRILNKAFYTSKHAPRCGVDDKDFHDVAHNKGRQDKQRREDFSPSSAP